MSTIRSLLLVDPCYGRPREGKLDTLTVAAGTGSATVAWGNAGVSTVLSYRLAAVAQDPVGGSQPPPAWLSIAPGTGCGALTTTVTGLRTGGWYVFWLDAITRDPTQPGTVTHDSMIARSGAVQIH